jgi:hypothetical protein
MKQPQYTEGQKALENFEEGMKALFKVPRAVIVPLKKRAKPVPSERKPKKSDRD